MTSVHCCCVALYIPPRPRLLPQSPQLIKFSKGQCHDRTHARTVVREHHTRRSSRLFNTIIIYIYILWIFCTLTSKRFRPSDPEVLAVPWIPATASIFFSVVFWAGVLTPVNTFSPQTEVWFLHV